MRSNISYWRISPLATSRMGWACRMRRSSSSASRITSVQDSREASRAGASWALPWVATRSRPDSLASYIARSALTSTSSPVRRSESNGATPTLALTARSRPDGVEMRDLADGVEEVGRGGLGLLRRAVGEQYGELVAAEPGDHGAAAQLLAQRVGDLADQLVPGAVAERVVDVLKWSTSSSTAAPRAP